ncbi:hypothetical protein BDZ45DRAFT_808898 [Acephala macrosclerotiorum]|nr:hypothetical protein BDZ45DRAFT_808898 [Acephala macrosclerotiorum]
MAGKLLYAYGNVKGSQGKLEESFAFHLRGLQQYKSTIGNYHYRTADLCVKVSNHYTRLGQYDAAMSLLDQALKIYGDCEYYDAEKARALYKKGRSLQYVSRESNKSNKSLNEALDLYRKLKKEKADFRRGIDELTDADFDDLIVFWSKRTKS